METNIFTNMPGFNTVAPTQNSSASNPSAQIKVKDAIEAANVKSQTNSDNVELSSKENEKEKKGPIKTVKSFIASIKKFFASAGAYINGTFKGITSGAVAGSVIYTLGSIINGIKAKSAAKTGADFKKLPNKAAAIAAAAIALAANIWNASLNATEKQSEIEHRWTGHN